VGEQFAPAVAGESAYEELCALFLGRTREEWAVALAGVDVCCEPVYTVEEALSSAPVQALGMLTDGLGGGLLPPLGLSAVAWRSSDPAPTLGQHTAELLVELGYQEEKVRVLEGRGVV
jgi:crotonobetainyl-CoA:carnitine CoA-transferase CaiB-like acyl-CoA transferase